MMLLLSGRNLSPLLTLKKKKKLLIISEVVLEWA